jgi:hypothetical protein
MSRMFFIDIKKIILKFIWNHNLEKKKNKLKELSLAFLKTYCKVIAWYYLKMGTLTRGTE